MKRGSTFLITLLLLIVSATSVTSRNVFRPDLSRGDDAVNRAVDAETIVIHAPKYSHLERRRGGGGGRGGGSGGGSGGRSGGGGSSGGRGGSTPPGSSPNSNIGGKSHSGSGSPRSYGGGSYYAGGSSVPYTAGLRSPLGIVPFFLPLGALAFFPGIWLYGAYAYLMSHTYHYHNSASGKNDTLPITCLCQQYSVCGCDDNRNSTYLNSLFNDTDANGIPRNSSTLVVANVNGTTGIYINGTLRNGTTAPDPSIRDDGAVPVKLLKLSGYWVMAAVTVVAATWL
ncbi:hypothetical protein VTO42DRAFT_3711 [Malbranchea cinnamomea]